VWQVEQWEKLRDGASSEVVLHDVMRIQIDRLRGELDELRSDYEALFKERKVLQSMIQDAGAGSSDSAQLAVELAQAHDALGSLQEERTHLLRQLLEQQRAQGDASAMRGAGGDGGEGGGGDGVGLLAVGLGGLGLAKGHNAGGQPGFSDARGRDSGSSGRGSNPFAESAAACSAPAFEDGMGAGSAAEQTPASEAASVFQEEEPLWGVKILKSALYSDFIE
jgi:hypothetical protein